jgi:hypothetical protein
VHIWEVAGSKEFAQHVINGNQIFLTYRQVCLHVTAVRYLPGVLQLAAWGCSMHPAGYRIVCCCLRSVCSLKECKTPSLQSMGVMVTTCLYFIGHLELLATDFAMKSLLLSQVTKAVVLIVLDLSVPGAVIPTALQWLQLVKSKLARTYSMFERKKLQLPEQLRNRQRTKVFNQHEDKELVDCCGEAFIISLQLPSWVLICCVVH